MSFRKFGGLQYAATHNIVKSNVNTTDSFYVTKNIGQPNTYINFESDISGNIIIYGDLDVSGNLHVTLDIDCSGNVNIDGNVDINGNLHVQEDIDCSGNVNIAGDVDINGNLHVQEDIDCSGNVTAEYMFLSSGTNYTTSPNGVVPKSYVDAVANGLTSLPPCVLCSNTEPITLSGYGQSIDGFTISSVYDASAVLVNAQGGYGSDASSNGIYIVSSSDWLRASYLDTGDKATGTATLILQGTTYADHRFVCTTGSNTSPAFIGTDHVIWNIFDSPFSLGQGLSKINIDNNTVIQVDSSLNFINYLDNTAGGTINIGTNTNTINIGSTTNAINIAGDIDCSGNLYVKKNIDCSGNLYVQNDAYINSVRVGRGGGNFSSNTVVGLNSLNSNTGNENTSIGNYSLYRNTNGSANTAIGYYSLLNNTTGANNTAIGTGSLFANTTGANNTAIGYQTLTSNTTGQNNTAIGYCSLFSNIDGSYNTAIGNDSLYSNTSGSYNTAIGLKSLYTNTSGQNNTAIGYKSLHLNTTGQNNTAIGLQALTSNTTGANNTAIGYQSLLNNTSGYSNTSIGYQSLLNNNTGHSNLALGVTSLANNTSGQLNTAIGNNTLINNITGSFNLALGDTSLTNNTIGSNNIAIGYQSGLDLSGNSNNNTFLGVNTNISPTTLICSNSTAVGYGALITASNQIVLGRSSETVFIPGKLITTMDASINSITVGKGGGNLSSNVVLGYQTLYKNTTGGYNTAIGYEALFNNTTSGYNTAIGYQALYSNTASGNLAFGSTTLYNNTTGYSNTAIGNNALISNTTGYSNTAIGVSALNYNISGIQNMAIGINSLAYTKSNYNTAIGNNSLSSNTSGANNTAIGYNSLYFNIDGSNNVAIGYYAGYNLSNNSSNNTFLGSNTNISPPTSIYSYSTAVGYGALITASNQIVLGRSSETVYVPGNVGIGTSISAGAYLSVNTGTTGNDMNAPDTDTSKGNGLLITSAKTGLSPYSMGLGVDYATGNGFISCAGNGGFTSLLLNPRGNGGKVGIGTTNPQSTLDVNGNLHVTLDIDCSGSVVAGSSGIKSFIAYQDTGGFYGMGTITSALCFSANLPPNTNPQMVLTTSGWVGIGKINPAYTLDVNGSVNATSYNSSSDYRIKKDVVALDNTFSVDNLRPVTYNNINLGKQDIGLIAHELQEIYPFLVTGEKDGENIQSVNYIGLIGILIKEIQELKKDIRLLKEKFI